MHRPEPDEQGGGSGVEERARQPDEFFSGVNLAEPALACAEGNERRFEIQSEDVCDGEVRLLGVFHPASGALPRSLPA